MLNSKLAIALAAAMAMAVLYGCSSNSGIKADRDEAVDRAETAEGTLAAIRTALGLAADADETAIVAEIRAATADELVMIRTALDLPADADVAAIVAELGMRPTEQPDPVEDMKAAAISDAIDAESAMADNLAQTDEDFEDRDRRPVRDRPGCR